MRRVRGARAISPRHALVESTTGRVEVDLVEVAQARPAGPDPRPQRDELLVRDLAERALDAEVGQVQVVLVDDRRDARVDLDHVLADELDVEEPLDRELLDELVGGRHQLLVLERDEVHREPGAHRLARLRVAEDDALAVRDPVDRALAAGRELHHEQVGAALGGQQLDRLLEPHRDRAGPLVQELVRAVDGRVEDAEAARAGGEDGLEADGAVRVAELVGGRRHLGGAVDAPEVGASDAEPLQQRVGLRLVVRAVDRVGRGDEHRHREAVAVRRQPLEVEGGLRQHDVDALPLDDLEHRVGEARIGAGRDEVEGVAEVAADRPLAHVGADEPHRPLAVRAQPLQQRRRARRAGGGDEDGDVLHERSIRSAASWSRRRSFSSSSIARIVSPIRVPG